MQSTLLEECQHGGIIATYVDGMHLGICSSPTVLELCAGGGGQALGLESAGFKHTELIELEPAACATLVANRPHWRVIQKDLNQAIQTCSKPELLAAGLPCPPFSIAGRQLGENDERNLFGAAMLAIENLAPKAILIENVKGLYQPRFAELRESIESRLTRAGYRYEWKVVNACDFGVAQLRPRLILVALRHRNWNRFRWPTPFQTAPTTVGNTLNDLMSANGWLKAKAWAKLADRIAPTIVGGSKKHGGPDLGPSRSKLAWAQLGVDGGGIALHAPPEDFMGMPKLTIRMVARLQGFGDGWHFSGTKTQQYRQIGNAFPPPVAEAIGKAIVAAI